MIEAAPIKAAPIRAALIKAALISDPIAHLLAAAWCACSPYL